jgi:VanZ family protein
MNRRPVTRAATLRPALTDAQWQVLRWLPFAFASLFSIVMSAMAPDGRRSFVIDWSLTMDALEFSIVKAPHISACAVLGLLGVMASGRRRWHVALSLTVATGAAWELCQTTVIGHYARLSDLAAPDTLGGLLGCMLGAAVLWTIEDWKRERD